VGDIGTEAGKSIALETFDPDLTLQDRKTSGLSKELRQNAFKLPFDLPGLAPQEERFLVFPVFEGEIRSRSAGPSKSAPHVRKSLQGASREIQSEKREQENETHRVIQIQETQRTENPRTGLPITGFVFSRRCILGDKGSKDADHSEENTKKDCQSGIG
jgi:hypothetical protein